MTHGFLLSYAIAEVKAEMARQNRRQWELAQVLGIHQTQVSDRLQGKVAFNLPELEAVATFLGVPVSQFVPEASRGFPPGGGEPETSRPAVVTS